MKRTPTAMDLVFVLGLTWMLARGAAGLLGLPPALGTLLTLGGAVVAVTKQGPALLQDGARMLFAPANAAHAALVAVEAPAWLLGAPETDAEEVAEDAAA